MRLTFLHLSDMHLQPDWHEESELVFRRFAEDLLAQAKKFENLHLIFSGDLVQAGSAEHYTHFSERFIKALDAAGIPSARRICVPGNHDLSRHDITPSLMLQRGALSGLTTETQFNNHVEQLSKHYFSGALKHYVEAEREFADYTCCANGLGGSGWQLSDDVGIYCLNTALCSCAGLRDEGGSVIVDRHQLAVDTRSLHKWLASAQTFRKRILILHHPPDWLVGWAQTELEKVIANEFDLVLSGHVHEPMAEYSRQGDRGTVHVSAPPLFTRKSAPLGYSFVSVDSETDSVEVAYRQWAANRSFVTGAALAGTDDGVRRFTPSERPESSSMMPREVPRASDTLSILTAELNEAVICYSSRRHNWVDRDLATVPENDETRKDAVLVTQNALASAPTNCVVRAPKGYGLSSLGRAIALAHFREKNDSTALAMLTLADIKNERQSIITAVKNRCHALGVTPESMAGVILDGFDRSKKAFHAVRVIRETFPGIPIILLEGIDDFKLIAGNADDNLDDFSIYYLWALSRPRIRDLVSSYAPGLDHLDDDTLVAKIVKDLDALNIHRTPLNCMMMLRLAEQLFDDSPVNRTEMIHRVLTSLFLQFDAIPTYAARPDLKDCEYALGYFCEHLIRTGRASFTKTEFFRSVSDYCVARLVDIDYEVLFAFLIAEHILVRRADAFEFRFSYWLHFFAAHRMHHEPQFCEFILSERRYSAFPEVMEFYAGIDRRRADAVQRLTVDLQEMRKGFHQRTQIPNDFNPWTEARWAPDASALEAMQRDVADTVTNSSLPATVKDAIADQDYDRARPYRQELAHFIESSTFYQMMAAVVGSARVLRNSDHVSPGDKTALLSEVVACWVSMCQLSVILSPALAEEKHAQFEDMGFYLGRGFDDPDAGKRWRRLMMVIPENVVSWFQDDIASRRLGPLLSAYARAHEDELGAFLAILLMVLERPTGWEKEVQRFIAKEQKNSYYLGRVFGVLYSQSKYAFTNERVRQDLLRLSGMAIAKHNGAKNPNNKQIERAVQRLEAESS